MNHASDIGIVGAGVSGLAAAWSLSRSGWCSTLHEKSRGLAGRAATRRRGEHCYDHGANFFRLDDAGIHELLTEHLPANELVEITGDVWTFDAQGNISPGDPAHNAVSKWSYRRGIKTIGRLLADDSPHAEVRRESQVTCIDKQDDGWMLVDAQGQAHGPHSILLMTPPAPQSMHLLNDCPAVTAELLAELGRINYHRQFCFVLGYDSPALEHRDYHALLNLDGQHEVSWLSFEEDKAGHVPPGQSVVVVQMSPAWSSPRYAHEREGLLPEVMEAVCRLLGQDLPEPAWWDSQRWAYACPMNALQPEILQKAEAAGLFFAGDATVGKGRVSLALRSGLEVADRIKARLACQ